MAFKFVTFLAVVAVASAQYQHSDYHHPSHHQPQYEHQHEEQQAAVYHHAAPAPTVLKSIVPAYKKVAVEYEDAHPKYNFAYEVHDEQTGDIKRQHEERDGDAVHGSYSLYDADGHHRIVEYTADDHNGFNAVVTREPTGQHHHAAPVQHHKIIAAAPVHKVVAAAAVPVYHAAAPVHVAAAAPVHHAIPVEQHTSYVPHAAPVHAHYAASPVQHAVPVAKIVAAPVHHDAHQYSHEQLSGNYQHHY